MPVIERQYERILTSVENQQILRDAGFTPVFSSNVSAIKRVNTALVIRFHNGSVYTYPQQGDRFGDLLLASSKGEWVWDNLRRPNVPYIKGDTMPLDGDRDLTDEELAQELERQGIEFKPIKLVLPIQPPIRPIQIFSGISSLDDLTSGILLLSKLIQ